MIRLLGRLLLFLSLMCAGLSPAMATARAPLVLAAASLQESLTAAADAWAAKGHARPVLSFAGSSALARQIEAGAPADLFISADEGWMDYVAQKGLIQPQTRTRSEEQTSELQSLMRITYAVFCLKKKKNTRKRTNNDDG